QKELGSKAGIPSKQVSYHLKKEEMEDGFYARFLAALRGRPAEVAIVTGCLESLDALSRRIQEAPDPERTAAEQDAVELGVLEVSRRSRPIFQEAVRLSRGMPSLDIYPRPADLEPARWYAGRLWEGLEPLPVDEQIAVVRRDREHQSWALM